MKNKRFSLKISIFHGIKAPDEGTLVGYGALIESYSLSMPLPNQLTLISGKNGQTDHLHPVLIDQYKLVTNPFLKIHLF